MSNVEIIVNDHDFKARMRLIANRSEILTYEFARKLAEYTAERIRTHMPDGPPRFEWGGDTGNIKEVDHRKLKDSVDVGAVTTSRSFETGQFVMGERWEVVININSPYARSVDTGSGIFNEEGSTGAITPKYGKALALAKEPEMGAGNIKEGKNPLPARAWVTGQEGQHFMLAAYEDARIYEQELIEEMSRQLAG